MKGKILIIMLIILAGSLPALAREYSVIVNPANSIQKLSARDVQDIFLGKSTAWPDGSKIKVAVFKKGDVHKTFLGDIAQLTPMQFSVYWKKIIFTGGGTPIMVVKDEAEMKDFIKANVAAIGYISPAALDTGIKDVPLE